MTRAARFYTTPPLRHQLHNHYITTTITDYPLPPAHSTIPFLPPPEPIYPDPGPAFAAIQAHARCIEGLRLDDS